ncbi:Hypothetical protein NGAL_HAMBI2566_01410 [Neorhizobium galegae bv. orientalis]|nr:Hypothetical protein NGAL_HAMBI2566_01410 [Neorhizobium galegae bv. orientalis]
MAEIGKCIVADKRDARLWDKQRIDKKGRVDIKKWINKTRFFQIAR